LCLRFLIGLDWGRSQSGNTRSGHSNHRRLFKDIVRTSTKPLQRRARHPRLGTFQSRFSQSGVRSSRTETAGGSAVRRIEQANVRGMCISGGSRNLCPELNGSFAPQEVDSAKAHAVPDSLTSRTDISGWTLPKNQSVTSARDRSRLTQIRSSTKNRA